MTYRRCPLDCSGYCSGWQSFWLVWSEVARQLQPLESAFNCLRGWMDVPLRNHDAAVTGNSHDGESVHSRFPKPCKHCMTEHKAGRSRPGFHLQLACFRGIQPNHSKAARTVKRGGFSTSQSLLDLCRFRLVAVLGACSSLPLRRPGESRHRPDVVASD